MSVVSTGISSQLLVFNTGRPYGRRPADGQEIYAKPYDATSVVFFDRTRDICGIVKCGLNRHAIMAEYDAGRYQSATSRIHFDGVERIR